MEAMVHEAPEDVAEAAARRSRRPPGYGTRPFSFGLARWLPPRATYKELRGRASGWGKVDVASPTSDGYLPTTSGPTGAWWRASCSTMSTASSTVRNGAN